VVEVAGTAAAPPTLTVALVRMPVAGEAVATAAVAPMAQTAANAAARAVREALGIVFSSWSELTGPTRYEAPERRLVAVSDVSCLNPRGL
jgi:hypothetical protein